MTEKPLVVDETFELNQTNKVRKMIEIYKYYFSPKKNSLLFG